MESINSTVCMFHPVLLRLLVPRSYMPAEAFPFIPGSERVNKNAAGPFAVSVISAPQTLSPLTFLQCLEGWHTEHEMLSIDWWGDYKGPAAGIAGCLKTLPNEAGIYSLQQDAMGRPAGICHPV